LREPLGQTGERREDALGAFPDECPLAPDEQRLHLEVLGHGHVREHAATAGDEEQAVGGEALGACAGDVAAGEHHRTGAGPLEPGDHPEQRRLAGAVRAEERERLAPAHVERDVEQHLQGAVREVDVLDAEQRVAGAVPRAHDVPADSSVPERVMADSSVPR
jgi:hypothetical protein